MLLGNKSRPEAKTSSKFASHPCAPQAAPWQDYDYDAALDAAVEGVHAAQRQHLAAQDQHRMLRLIVSGAP